MSEKTGFFEEQPGHRSMNRLMCFLSLLMSFACAAITLATDGNMVGYYLALTFLGFAIGGKETAKLIELGFAAKK